MTIKAIFILPLAGALLVAVPGAPAAEDTFTNGVNIQDTDPDDADLFVSDNTVLSGATCLGESCTDSETFTSGTVLKFSDDVLEILFNDSSPNTEPDRNWALRVNDASSFGLERFMIVDMESGTPFTIEGGAPDSAFWIDSDGEIGIGTMMPDQDLHVVSGTSPALRLEQDISGGETAYEWDIFGNSALIGFYDGGTDRTTFSVAAGAPLAALTVEADGDVGIGTASPEGKLHTKGDGVQLAYFESGNGGPVQIRMRTDSTNRRFLATNNSNQVKSQIIFGDSEIKFAGATDNGPNLWLSIGPSGIVSQGPTCGSPCDDTFDPSVFQPLPIEKHAALMWQNRYLGAIGPTGPEMPLNLTEKIGGVIHELEVAHIYIEELHARLDKRDRLLADLLSLLAAEDDRFQALSVLLAD